MTEPLTRGTRVREVDLTGIPPGARARALALEAAELFRAGWTDAPGETRSSRVAAPNPQPRSTAAGPLTAPPREDRPPARVRVDGAAETRVYVRGGAAFFGGRLSLSFPLAPWLVGSVDAGAALGSAHDPLGDISMGLATAGARLLALGGGRSLALGVGPRLDVGAAWYSGNPASPLVSGASDAGPIAALGLDAVVYASMTPAWGLLLDAEGGMGIKSFGATADGRLVADAAGPFLTVRAGLAFFPF
jgi:hypothetical protein